MPPGRARPRPGRRSAPRRLDAWPPCRPEPRRRLPSATPARASPASCPTISSRGWRARRPPAYRARQVGDAVWRDDAAAFDDVRTLPAPLREASSTRPSASTPSTTPRLRLSDGGLTEKGLHRLSDGALDRVGPDALPGPRRASASATPCASRARRAARSAARSARPASSASPATSRPPRSSTRSATPPGAWPTDGKRLTNVVFMGMGEPLLNLDRVLDVGRRAQRPASGSGSARGTSRSRRPGSCPGIRRLTALGPQFTLAVSLHAARDALRDVLVPLNRRWPVAEVVAAARDHAARDRPPGDLRDDDDRRDQRHARRTPRRWPSSSAATTPMST